MGGRKKHGGGATNDNTASATSPNEHQEEQEDVSNKENTAVAKGAAAGGASDLLGQLQRQGNAEEKQAQFAAAAKQLLEDKGENAVQDALRKEIQRTKKLESDAANIKKRIEAMKRETDSLNQAQLKDSIQKNEMEQGARVLLDENQRFKQVHAEKAAELETLQDKYGDSITHDVSETDKGVEKCIAEAKELEEENVTLREEFDGLRGDFEKQITDMQEKWKEQEEETKVVIEKLKIEIGKNEELRAVAILLERESTSLKEGIVGLEKQAVLYKEKWGELEGSFAMDDSQIKELAEKRKAELMTNIETLEKIKEQELKLKQAADAEANRLRAATRQLKGKLSQLEKQKTKVEVRVRDAQKKAGLAH